jgi:hypothetical protein
MALAIMDGPFILVGEDPEPEPMRMTCYAYENHDLPRLTYGTKVWLKNGQVKYQTRFEITPWHGSYRFGINELELFFDCHGNPQHKSTYLFRHGTGQYRGYDYRRRRIQMNKLGEFIWDEDQGSWVPIEW